jgi:hypothetical protein
MDIAQISVALVTALAPFTPYLIKGAGVGGKKFVEAIASKGGDAAWQKAQNLWGKLMSHFGNDDEIEMAAKMIAKKPEDETRRMLMAEVLGTLLQKDEELVQDIFETLGGEAKVQKIIADHGSLVRRVSQTLKGKGKQLIIADNASVIEDVEQKGS